MDKEKLSIVLEYFEKAEIQLPTAVKNAIEDVFMENDDVDAVECYHLEDLDAFQEDLTLENHVEMFMGGSHKGETTNVWTYYGEISYSLTEEILLVDDDGQVLEEVSKYSSGERTSLVELPSDYVISFIEKVKWDGGKKEYSRTSTLYIYCPVNLVESGE